MNEHDALIVLNAIPNLGGLRLRKLLEHFGSARAVLEARPQDLVGKSLLAEKWVGVISTFPREEFLKKERALMLSRGVTAVTIEDADYPDLLKEIPGAPVVLYVKGNISSLKSPSVAVVGSRRASLYGLSVAEKLAVDLAQAGLTVVSGLALGVDTAAHRGALKAKGTTIAVLGNGLADVFPRSNERLLPDIAAAGAVVSEFPMTMPPMARNFPQRNRIISGLSLGVVVAEASLKSGALITADFALEQGRDVFAVPGPIGNPASEGVHRLIQQGAKLICRVDDVLQELNLPPGAPAKPARPGGSRTPDASSAAPLAPETRRILEQLNDEPLHVDRLAERIGTASAGLAAALLALELKHLVKQLPGKYFIRQRQLN